MSMPQGEYFKVIESKYIEENKILNTNDINFGKRILAFPYKRLEPFIKKICELDKKYNYGLNLYLELPMQIIHSKMTSFDYFNYLENKYNGKINISCFTGNSKSNVVKIDNLRKICKELKTTINIDLLNNNHVGTYLQEYIFEEERKNNFSDKISRLESYFVFKDKLSSGYFKDRWEEYNYNHEIVKIIPKNVDNYFEGDIKHIDDIENHITVYEYRDIANRYWQGKLTNDPVIETFFQGTFEMNRL